MRTFGFTSNGAVSGAFTHPDSGVEDLSPDSAVHAQLEGQWQKVAMLLLWKLAGREPVRITGEEMARFREEFAPGIPVLFTHGTGVALEFRLVDEASAQRILEHERSMRGTA